MTKEKLQRYAELKLQEKSLKEEISALGTDLKAEMAAENVDKVTSDFGNFSLKPVNVWKYSEEVDKLEEKVDELKKEEKANGKATSEVRTDLVFTSLKPKASEE